jgi:ADP-heptose:LPS heptosyltransferase
MVKIINLLFKDSRISRKLNGLLNSQMRFVERAVKYLPLAIAALSRLPLVYASRAPKQAAISPKSISHALDKPRTRVAVIRFDGLGDHVLTIPLISALAENKNVETVTFLVPVGLGPIFEENVECRVLPVRPYSVHYPLIGKNALGFMLTISGIGQVAAWLSGRKYRGQFDVVVLPRWDADYALNARAFAIGTGAAVIGHNPKMYSTLFPIEKREIVTLDEVISSPDASRHELEHLSELVQSLGLRKPTMDAYASRFFGITNAVARGEAAPLIGIHMGATDPKRRWPLERWRSLITEILREEPRVRFYFVGSNKTEFEEIAKLEGNFTSLNVLRSTREELPLLKALSNVSVFVGSDSGPMHLASSIGARTVTISCHSTSSKLDHVNSPARFRPAGENIWLAPVDVAPGCTNGCDANYAHCVLGVSVDAVTAAVIAQLR